MNMSYCRFKNTASDLFDCVEAMADSENILEMNLTNEERQSMAKMKEYCEYFLQEYERLTGEA